MKEFRLIIGTGNASLNVSLFNKIAENDAFLVLQKFLIHYGQYLSYQGYR